jgi:hypothetical protein
MDIDGLYNTMDRELMKQHMQQELSIVF